HTVTGQQTSQFTATSGGIAFRAFGSNKYWDTVTLDTGAAAPVSRNNAGSATPLPSELLLPPDDPRSGPGSRDDIPLPFQYASVPGSGIDLQLDALDQLKQVPNTGIVNGMVGLTYRNISWNIGTYQVGWGPALAKLDLNDTPVNSPDFQFYMYRQLPGEETLRIGESGLKRTFDSDQSDFQFLPPGIKDAYNFSNYQKKYWSPATGINP